MTLSGAVRAVRGRWGWVGLTVFVVYPAGLIYILVLTPLAGAPVDGALAPVVVFSLPAVTGAWRAGRTRQLDARTRRAWQLFAAGLALMVTANALTDAVTRATAFPSPTHYARFAAALLLVIALHRFPLHTGDRPQRFKLGVDAAIVLATGTMVIWYFVVSPYLQHSGAAGTVLVGGLYPVIDLILVFVAVRLQLRAANPGTRRAARLLTGALMVLLLNDTLDAYHQALTPGASRGNPVTHTLIMTVFALLALFPREQLHLAGEPAERARRRTATVSRLPPTAVKLSCALMTVATVHEQGLSRVSGLIVAGTAVTLLVLLRQQITQRENLTLATTDALTGAANRARIDEVLARTLDLGARNGRHTALLLADLNGFKTVNDTLGHTAGDALLVQFAALLRRSVLGADLVGRLGGDEFVVLLHGDHDHADATAVVRRITAAMTEPLLIAGTIVQPSASLGVAVSGPGELQADELLHRADIAMYHQKKVHNSTAEADRGSPKN